MALAQRARTLPAAAPHAPPARLGLTLEMVLRAARHAQPEALLRVAQLLARTVLPAPTHLEAPRPVRRVLLVPTRLMQQAPAHRAPLASSRRAERPLV